jgi:hypothetical protein
MDPYVRFSERAESGLITPFHPYSTLATSEPYGRVFTRFPAKSPATEGRSGLVRTDFHRKTRPEERFAVAIWVSL